MQTVDSMERAVDAKVLQLASVFHSNINDFFFTEKELHSYFYHLCLSDDDFFRFKGYSLIHTEYPSPFKCSLGSIAPFVAEEPIDSDSIRAHYDCVFLNPNFIQWLLNNDSPYGMRPLIGVGGNRFDQYILDFYEIYTNFNRETNQPILAYALEFKFLRQSYVGSKYPVQNIRQDVCKLRLLKQFQSSGHEIDFVKKTKSLIFIGDRNASVIEKIEKALADFQNDEYEIISRGTP